MKWVVLACVVAFAGAAPAYAQARVSVQAVCMDARGLPHPAAQTFPERDVAESYVGEIFRCLPGTALRFTADARIHDCAAGEALWYEDRRVSCRAENAFDAEQERDLLRRLGAGEKTVEIASGIAPPAARSGPRIVNGYARTN